MTNQQNSKLYTVRQTCETLQIGRTLLYGLCKVGAIKSIKVGKRGIRVPSAENVTVRTSVQGQASSWLICPVDVLTIFKLLLKPTTAS